MRISDWSSDVFSSDLGMLAHYSGEVDLPPHVDNARLVVNGFVYLDDRNGTPPEPLRGTMLYRSIGFAWPTNRDIPQALRDLYLREAGEVEWRDNRLLAYINGTTTVHALPRPPPGRRARRPPTRSGGGWVGERWVCSGRVRVGAVA